LQSFNPPDIEEIHQSPPPPITRSGLQYTPAPSSRKARSAAAQDIFTQIEAQGTPVMPPRALNRATSSPPVPPPHLERPGLLPHDLSLAVQPSLSQAIASAIRLAPEAVAASTSVERLRLAHELNSALQSKVAMMEAQLQQNQQLHSMELEIAQMQNRRLMALQKFNAPSARAPFDAMSSVDPPAPTSHSQPIHVSSSESPSPRRPSLPVYTTKVAPAVGPASGPAAGPKVPTPKASKASHTVVQPPEQAQPLIRFSSAQQTTTRLPPSHKPHPQPVHQQPVPLPGSVRTSQPHDTATAPHKPEQSHSSQASQANWLRAATAQRTADVHSQQQASQRAAHHEARQQKAEAARKLALDAEHAIIADAQKRIISMQQGKLTFKVRKQATASASQAHAAEKRLAILTGDHELLKHGSDRVKKEAMSEDDADDIRAELPTAVAAHNLFHPRAPMPVRVGHGYVNSDFIADDDDENIIDEDENVDDDEDDDGEDADDDEDEDDDGDDADNDGEQDDAGDPDYEQTDTPTPSPTRKSVSRSEWQAFLAFKRAQHTTAPAPAPPPEGKQTFNIVVATPPEHGDWRDIQHLTTVFKDKHIKYRKACNGATYLSVWECYTPTDQENIIKQLHQPQAEVQRNAAYLSSLSDDAFYKLLGDELGLSYTTAVEQALTAISFKGNILDRSNWVIFNTGWSQVLRRVTSAGTVQPRRLVELFRDNIPDPFVQEWLRGRRFQSWEDAYDGIIASIEDHRWMACYIKDKEERLHKPPAKPAHAPAPAPAAAPKHSAPPANAPAPAPAAPANNSQQPSTFNPLTFKDRRGNVNVNPKMLKNPPNLNKGRTPCDRCNDETVHNWPSSMCTSSQDKNKKPITPALSPEEFQSRMQQRWDAGFFFSKDISAYKSPSAGASAAASQSASARIIGANGGK